MSISVTGQFGVAAGLGNIFELIINPQILMKLYFDYSFAVMDS